MHGSGVCVRVAGLSGGGLAPAAGGGRRAGPSGAEGGGAGTYVFSSRHVTRLDATTGHHRGATTRPARQHTPTTNQRTSEPARLLDSATARRPKRLGGEPAKQRAAARRLHGYTARRLNDETAQRRPGSRPLGCCSGGNSRPTAAEAGWGGLPGAAAAGTGRRAGAPGRRRWERPADGRLRLRLRRAGSRARQAADAAALRAYAAAGWAGLGWAGENQKSLAKRFVA